MEGGEDQGIVISSNTLNRVESSMTPPTKAWLYVNRTWATELWSDFFFVESRIFPFLNIDGARVKLYPNR